jgi:hypothetical protein
MAGAVRGVAGVNAEILHAEAADGGGHPAILIAMIVHAAGLANFPADGHAFEDGVFEDEVASVISLGEKEIGIEGVGSDGVMENVVLDGFEREFVRGDGGEALYPIGYSEFLGGELFGHEAPPVRGC